MSKSLVTIRPVQSSDAEGLADLNARSADGGRVGLRPHRKVSLLEAIRIRGDDTTGLVAISADGALVGSGWLTYLATSDVAPVAYLHSLDVHPDWRRQGIARRLTDARLAHIAGRGQDHVVVASIQAGNEASIANTRRWATRSLGRLRVTPVPPPRRMPRLPSGLVVRSVEPGDLIHVAEGLRAHAARHVLAPTPDPEQLNDWLDQEVADARLNEYTVVVRDGRVVAGIGVQDESRISLLEVTRMPRLVSIANIGLRVVPADRLMRNLNVRLPWFEPGQEQAARYLWQAVRWRRRGDGTSAVVEVDPTSSLAPVFHIPRWLPSTTLQIVVREPRHVRLSELPLALTP